MDSPSTCGATLRAASGNQLARAARLEAEGAPLLAAVARAGELHTCTLPAGHDPRRHREDWGHGFGVEWGPAVEEALAPRPLPALPIRRATTRARR